jgi:hypothetical protein
MLASPNKLLKQPAARYKTAIDARVGAIANSGRDLTRPDAHYLFAQVRLRREFAAAVSHESLIMSCDDMNKVNIGVLAVSRYHQLSRLFMKGDNPISSDHDFP